MFEAFTKFFNALSTLFIAMDKGAKSINNLCEWAEEASGSLVDEQRENREIAREERAIERAKKRAALQALKAEQA